MWAQEGPHPVVAQRVGLEALLRAVAPATLSAKKGLVACVHKRMLLQVAQLQECFATLTALVLALTRGASGWAGRT